MTSKIHTDSDSSVPISSGSASFDTTNPALLRYMKDGIAIDCMGLTESQCTFKIYLLSRPLKVFRQTVNLSGSIEQFVMMAANRLCLHYVDLFKIVNECKALLKEYLNPQPSIYIF